MKHTTTLSLAAAAALASPAMAHPSQPSSSRSVLSWDIPEYLKLSELYGAPDNDFSCRSDRNPVVLLHGLSADREVDLNMLQKELNGRGYCTFSLTYGAHTAAPWIGGLKSMRDDSAAEIADFIREVHEKSADDAAQRKKVDLVGHSEGGVMTLYVPMTQDGIPDIVERTVALGPAVHGAQYYGFTDLLYAGGDATRKVAGAAIKALGCAACDDMATGGAVYADFLARSQALAAGTSSVGIVPAGVKATVVMSRSDTLVSPEVSQVDEAGVRNVFVQDACPDDKVGHAGLMWDRSVWGLVYNALEEEYDRVFDCDKGLEI
ncbi:hypothetical protein SLS62_000853 [Diatrype stigma]|uniref:AB hydrolase-1 domain-containing protein n=1 Tax=Diatrype stigma TaxID=117547 RepID=A0AAN9UZM5_9PEZI